MSKFSTLIPSYRPFVIAEIGNNHEGDIAAARDLIYAAKESGVDAVKFQAIVPSSLVSSDQSQRIDQLNKFCLTMDEFKDLSALAKKLNLIFFTSVFDINLVDELSKIQKIFKISSGDNTYTDLIDRVAHANLPTIISTGGLCLKQIDDLQTHFLPVHNETENLALLHCVSNYPTLPENAQLGMIELMRLRYPKLIVGYSDHTLGNDACYLAAALGAKIIEKHFTMSHTFSDFRDHQLSANPTEMTELIRSLPEAYSLVGRSKADLNRSDLLMTGVRRKAIASRIIAAGEKFNIENIKWLRVTKDSGIADRDLIYGKNAARDIEEGELIDFESIQG